MKKLLIGSCMILFASAADAQTLQKGFFRLSSPQNKDEKSYGQLHISAGEKQTVVLNTIMAYGENVKGLTISINKGFPFKLAPAQTGAVLNYVAPDLNIVLQPGDHATIEFIDADKKAGAKNLYLSGEVKE